jgi:hypothetical protein
MLTYKTYQRSEAKFNHLLFTSSNTDSDERERWGIAQKCQQLLLFWHCVFIWTLQWILDIIFQSSFILHTGTQNTVTIFQSSFILHTGTHNTVTSLPDMMVLLLLLFWICGGLASFQRDSSSSPPPPPLYRVFTIIYLKEATFIECCSCSVVAIYGKCNVSSHDEHVVLLH